MTKSILFIMSHPPYQGLKAHESLDLLLITASFKQKVSVLYQEDGIFQLVKHQQGDLVGVKNIDAISKSLDLYDIENVYVDRETLLARNLTEVDLTLPVILLSAKEIGNLLSTQDIILNL